MPTNLRNYFFAFATFFLLPSCGNFSSDRQIDEYSLLEKTPICESSFSMDYQTVQVASIQVQRAIQFGDSEASLYQKVRKLDRACQKFIAAHPYDEECQDEENSKNKNLRFSTNLSHDCVYAKNLLHRWTPRPRPQ